MFSRLQWLALQLFRKVWVRVSAFTVLGVATALIALLVRHYIPGDLPAKIGANAVDSLLHIIAVSMLSVTIFSLSTIVSALASATAHVTPRATLLLASDSKAQNALATFLGSFVFSLVGIIGLQTGLYGSTGRVVLYVVTLLVIVLIVLTLLRWIDYVLSLGRVGPTSERVEAVAMQAMTRRRDAPYLGGRRRPDRRAVPDGGSALLPERMGFVGHVDIGEIQALAEKQGLEVHLAVLPGGVTSPAEPLAYVVGTAPDACLAAIRDAFTVDDNRSFDQDPRFGLRVLAEIAMRALSPALNDPGTAIDLLSRGARVIAAGVADRDDAEPDSAAVACPRVHVPTEHVDDLFDDFFAPISRDAAGHVEVGIHLQQVLAALGHLGDGRYQSAAHRHALQAMARARAALSSPEDLARLEKAAASMPRTAS